MTEERSIREHKSHEGLSHLINFDLLSVRVEREALAFEARSRLDLPDDDGAHVGVLVDDRHHERAVDVALKRRQGIQVRNERLLPTS